MAKKKTVRKSTTPEQRLEAMRQRVADNQTRLQIAELRAKLGGKKK